MQAFTFHIDIEKPFSNLTLSDHVLIMIKTANGKLVVSRKDSYPPGIWRLIGGKIDKKEKLADTAKRELLEETQLNIPSSRITYIAAIRGEATDADFNEYALTSHIYLINLKPSEEPKASDDIDELQAIPPQAFADLIETYRALSPNSWVYKNGYKKFSWYDYGQYYAAVHQIALDLVSTTNP